MRCFKPLFVLLLAGAAPVALGSGTQLSVSAIVAKFARLGVQGQPSEMIVNESDVTRGYVEIPDGARIELASNSREGVRLEFLSRLPGDIVRGIEVSGLPEGALLAGQGRGVARWNAVLGYRILLSPAARPGIYPWPVHVVATPL